VELCSRDHVFQARFDKEIIAKARLRFGMELRHAAEHVLVWVCHQDEPQVEDLENETGVLMQLVDVAFLLHLHFSHRRSRRLPHVRSVKEAWPRLVKVFNEPLEIFELADLVAEIARALAAAVPKVDGVGALELAVDFWARVDALGLSKGARGILHNTHGLAPVRPQQSRKELAHSIINAGDKLRVLRCTLTPRSEQSRLAGKVPDGT
jgi:hypothetical protein